MQWLKAHKIVILISFLVLVVPTSTHAITIHFNVDYPAIPAPVPGGRFDLNCVEGKSGDPFCTSSFIYAPTIGNAVVFIFIAAIWVSGVIAFISLLYAGYLYILSGASPGMRARAKERLVNVLWGIAIILLATLIINFINTDIAGLRLTGARKVTSQEPKETLLSSNNFPPNSWQCIWMLGTCRTQASCIEGFFSGSTPCVSIDTNEAACKQEFAKGPQLCVPRTSEPDCKSSIGTDGKMLCTANSNLCTGSEKPSSEWVTDCSSWVKKWNDNTIDCSTDPGCVDAFRIVCEDSPLSPTIKKCVP